MLRLRLVLLAILLAVPAYTEPATLTRLLEAALAQTLKPALYDGSYRRIAYPGGDVPSDRGVCTDVVIRAYRGVGFDLQKLVHEDMREHFAKYPKLWGLQSPDANIDHRRVPNLRTFFSRHGEALAVSVNPDDYRPGDLVTWVLPRNLPHIGVVSGQRSGDGERPLIIHNIGAGPKVEDMLFEFTITGHYRWSPWENPAAR